MKSKDSFLSDRKFYALDRYPYGIGRSGDYSREQARLLECHGMAYQMLDEGSRTPVNEEERRFVAICRGEKMPQTPHEKVWVRFREKINAVIVPIAVTHYALDGISEDYSGSAMDMDF